MKIWVGKPFRNKLLHANRAVRLAKKLFRLCPRIRSFFDVLVQFNESLHNGALRQRRVSHGLQSLRMHNFVRQNSLVFCKILRDGNCVRVGVVRTRNPLLHC